VKKEARAHCRNQEEVPAKQEARGEIRKGVFITITTIFNVENL